MDPRVHLLGIRHHGPGSAALLRRALDALDPQCVLLEGPPEAGEMIRYASLAGMKPPVALLLHAASNANAAFFIPFAEFSPEWQAIQWALRHERMVRFIDWPAGIHLYRLLLEANSEEKAEPVVAEAEPDPLDALAAAAGFTDGEAFWNAMIEQGHLRENAGSRALEVFTAIESAMTAVRADSSPGSEEDARRQSQREAWMRMHIRQALRECPGTIAAVTGAWHTPALRVPSSAAADKQLVRDLPREKAEVTWVPWTDSRLSAASRYAAGVIAPGWYRHLWALYEEPRARSVEQFAAQWQARSAALLRTEGYPASTAAAIEAARLALALASIRCLPVPGIEEMREAALATLCHGEEVPLRLIQRKLYIGERVGEIDADVPQMPLARDLAAWQRKTRLKPTDIDQELRVDLRSEAGLLKSTLLHRLTILHVPWGRLVETDGGRGTFREMWMLRWIPELSVALAEALVYGGTIEQAAANALLSRASQTNSIGALSGMIRAALVADLPDAAGICIEKFQAAAVQASEITELMQAVAPLVNVLRYGTARRLPEEQLRALICALSVEVNAGARAGSHDLDEDAAEARVTAMRAYDESLRLFGDAALLETWQRHLGDMVHDGRVAPPIAGLSLRLLHDAREWEPAAVETAFSRRTHGETPQRAGAFLETFLSGGSELLLQDQPLLVLVDKWLCMLADADFIEMLPLLRRSFSDFDAVARRRLLAQVTREPHAESPAQNADPTSSAVSEDAFARALPLLCRILGIEPSTLESA
jgi:hypothetical protein